MIRSIGQFYASKLVEAIGDQVFKVIEKAPERHGRWRASAQCRSRGSARPGPIRRWGAKSWSSSRAMSTAAAAAWLMDTSWQLDGDRTPTGWSRFSHDIHSHKLNSRPRRWGSPWCRPHCRTAGSRGITGFPPEPCDGSRGRRTAGWKVCPGLCSWSLHAECLRKQSDATGSLSHHR